MKRLLLTTLLVAVLGLGISCAAAPSAAQRMILPSAPPVPAEMDDTTTNALPQAGKAEAPGEPGGGVTEGYDALADTRMIVYTGLLSLQVNDTVETVNKIEGLLQSVNGYVASKSLVEYSENKMRGTIQVRLPAASLNTTLPLIKALGVKVLKETQDSNDVTAEYTDLDARRKNLEAYEIELQKLLETVRERTGKAEDILAVYNQLTQVRGEIEQIRGRQNYLENTSALATYTIELVPIEEVVVEGTPGWNPGNTARAALDNLVAALQTFGDIAITFVLFILPILLILILPLVVVFFVLRAIAKRRAVKKPAAAS